MKARIVVVMYIAALGGAACFADHPPLALHPENPHYFLFRGQPTVFISSAEHYGAVLNADFDFKNYLAELEKHHLNHTRTFTGSYCEQPGAFRIEKNTLAPAAGRLLCPWARSGTPGYVNGGNKFDLTKWDEAYFRRLKDFMAEASRRGIVVELNLFCPFYEEAMWRLSPMNGVNNVNDVGRIDRNDVYQVDRNGGLMKVQEAMVRKIVAELRGFDNLYYEVCNEPYQGSVPPEWERRIVDVIVSTERDDPHQHLISLNIANKSAKIVNPHPSVSIFNFHYAVPPTAVAENYGLNRPIGDNETGFRGVDDEPYRREAWEFMLAGGALFSHLDYSFAVGFEDGTFKYPDTQPGGGNRAFRQQMRVLREFLGSFDFVKMKPSNGVLRGEIQEEATAYVLAEPGRQYALYVSGSGTFVVSLELPVGSYQIEWINVLNGTPFNQHHISHAGGTAAFKTPPLQPDVAMRIKRLEE